MMIRNMVKMTFYADTKILEKSTFSGDISR